MTQLPLTDLDAAASLLVNGCRLQGVAPTRDPRRGLCVLACHRDHAVAVLADYRSGRLLVNAKAFVHAQRRLRRALSTVVRRAY